jgi:hypothetical protein
VPLTLSTVLVDWILATLMTLRRLHLHDAHNTLTLYHKTCPSMSNRMRLHDILCSFVDVDCCITRHHVISRFACITVAEAVLCQVYGHMHVWTWVAEVAASVASIIAPC